MKTSMSGREILSGFLENSGSSNESNAVLVAADAMLRAVPIVTIARMAERHGLVLVYRTIDDATAAVGCEAWGRERDSAFDLVVESPIEQEKRAYAAMVEHVMVRIPQKTEGAAK